jgi:hypothetical protein
MHRIHPRRDIPLAQRKLFGSAEWKAAYDRRGRVEGGYSNLKNEATTNIKRGTIRVMGLIKTGIMVLMAQAVTNVRLGHAYRTSKGTAARSGDILTCHRITRQSPTRIPSLARSTRQQIQRIHLATSHPAF